jgi:hypothetical protein
MTRWYFFIFFNIIFNLTAQDKEKNSSKEKTQLSKDSLVLKSKNLSKADQKVLAIDSTILKKKKLKNETTSYVKSMDSITILDYKIMYSDGRKTSADTSLTIYKDYKFNFLKKDYFELLPLANMGEGFNRLGYDFHADKITPQMGARSKHFAYLEKEDIPYFNVPSPFTELFFKSTFDKGQYLNSLVAINTSPRLNFSIAYTGFRSLGNYDNSKSSAAQFRFSSQYESSNKKHLFRFHNTSQKLENDVNGGLTNDSDYFFKNSPNYAIINSETGLVEIDENGKTIYENYSGFMDRSRLVTQIKAENKLSGKRYFLEYYYNFLPSKKENVDYETSLGSNLIYEKKTYSYFQNIVGEYFSDSYLEKDIADITNFKTIENNIFAVYKTPLTGDIKLNIQFINWDYSFEEDEYIEEERILPKINSNQIAGSLNWKKKILGFNLKSEFYQSLKGNYSSSYFSSSISRKIFDKIDITSEYQFRERPPNFNFYLYKSDFINYNWKQNELKNQKFSTLTIKLGHPKWGQLLGQWNKIDDFAYFLNTTTLIERNKRFNITPGQTNKTIDNYKIKFFQHLDLGKFSFINTIQYQKVIQEEDPALLFNFKIINVPEWITRNTIMLSTDLFKKALFIQTGFTFKFFTNYYGDQYNPLIGEFVSQNEVKIGEYPMLDFFLNSKIQQTRVFIKIENLSGKIEHLINEDAKYDYYSAPYMPYRDFSVRLGLVWNFFQ